MRLIGHFLLENGVGQNLTAGLIVFLAGLIWSRTKYWPLHALHAKLDQHEAHHAHHREHLAMVGHSLAELHDKLDRLSVADDARATLARPREPPA